MTESQQDGFTEVAVNKAVEMGLASQLKEAKNLQIDVQIDPSKLVSGEVDGVNFHGEGLVTPQDIRLEEVTLETNAVAINLLKVVFGEFKLSHPTDASAKVVLTEADLNRALNSDYLRQKFCKLPIPLNNETMFLTWKRGSCHLPGDAKLELKASLLVELVEAVQEISLFVVVRIPEDGGMKIFLEEGKYLEGKGLSLCATSALLSKVNEFLQQRHFNLKDIAIALERLKVEQGKIILWVQAHIEEIA